MESETIGTVVENPSPEMLEIIEKRMANLRKSVKRFYAATANPTVTVADDITFAMMANGLINHMAREFEVLELNHIAVPTKITFEFNKICEEFRKRSYGCLP